MDEGTNRGKQMNYEISNIRFNHKPTKREVQTRHPFYSKLEKKQQTFYNIPDEPRYLFKAYSLGHCIKPRAFRLDEGSSGNSAKVNTIILDFDNLTEVQCKFVKAVVNGKFKIIDEIYGDYSAGMKSLLKENEGISNYNPPKWKFKVFFPVENCLCRYEDVHRAFLEAVAFFNPTFPMDDVVRVFKAWVKCNNNKKRNNRLKVTDPMFKGWILPDVAMLNSYRTQVTYSCNPEQKEKVKVVDDFDISRSLPVGMNKYKVTGISDYQGLDWKDEDCGSGSEKVDLDKELVKKTSDYIEKFMSSDCEWKFKLPTSRSEFAKKLRKCKFDDLVVPIEIGIFNALRFAPPNLTLEIEKLKMDISKFGRMFTYIAMEFNRQGGAKTSLPDIVESVVRGMMEIHGMKLMEQTISRGWNKVLAYEMAKSIAKAGKTYANWRARQKLKETTTSEEVIGALEKWRQSGSRADFVGYLKAREKDIKARIDEVDAIKMNYTYGRRDVKKELIHKALNRQLKFDTMLEFVGWARENMNKDRFDGDFKDETFNRWYEEYRAIWNNTHLKDNQIGRKQRKSKWDDMFKGKSKEEISDAISKLEVSKQMKYKLRLQYLR